MGNLSYVGIFVILSILGILYTLWVSSKRQKTAAQLRESGVRVEAEITGLEFVPATWKNDAITREAYYRLTYRFRVNPTDTPYVRTVAVSRQLADSQEVGLTIPVLYLPGDPAVSMLESDVDSQSSTGIADSAKVFLMFTTAVALLALLLNVMHW